MTVTCDVDYEDTKDSIAVADDEDNDRGSDDYDHDHDHDNHEDHDDSYLTCIDAEPVKHLCQLASLLLKLVCLQLQQ